MYSKSVRSTTSKGGGLCTGDEAHRATHHVHALHDPRPAVDERRGHVGRLQGTLLILQVHACTRKSRATWLLVIATV